MKKYILLVLSLATMLVSCNSNNKVNTDTGDVLVREITLSKTEITINEGEKSTLSVVEIKPLNASVQRVVWSVEDMSKEGCVAVDKDGMVTGMGKGTATVVATAIDGSNAKATCLVTVLSTHGGAPYEVGDPYPDEIDPIGIVFAVEEDGNSGKIVSLHYGTELSWGDNHVTTSATDELDGLWNTKLVQTKDEGFANSPAFKWVDDTYNNGAGKYETGAKNVWYIPAEKELRQLFAGMCGLVWRDGSTGQIVGNKIYDWGTDAPMTNYWSFEENVANFNETIVEYGGEAITKDWHCSSTEIVDFFSWYVDLYSGITYHYDKSIQYDVRPIMAF